MGNMMDILENLIHSNDIFQKKYYSIPENWEKQKKLCAKYMGALLDICLCWTKGPTSGKAGGYRTALADF